MILTEPTLLALYLSGNTLFSRLRHREKEQETSYHKEIWEPMEEIQTWRELLRKIISDPQERQRIAEELHVNPITLIRWTTGKSRPRPDNLSPLLDSIPHYREQLQDLISKEFPH